MSGTLRILIRRLTVGLFAASACATAFGAAKPVSVVDLSCEYLRQPLGIDETQPRLSWRMETLDATRRGLRQSSYRIIVASTASALAKGKGDLWDSGDVRSNRSVLVPYKGKPLRSEEECWWKVRLRDGKGNATAWSKPARWTMGLLHPSDWHAEWIGANEIVLPKEPQIPDPWLRKEFTLAQAPTSAVIHVASIGYHELYVNGEKVGDADLEGAVADYTKRARYRTYEIGKYLKKGRNVIGLWLGTGWSIYPTYDSKDRPPKPLVIAQATIALPGAKPVRIVTDETWQNRDSPNRLLGHFGRGSFGGEIFDARLDDPNWCSVDDRAKWDPAQVWPMKRILSAEVLEPNRIEHILHPVAVQKLPDGGFRLDMGKNFAGWVEVPVQGAPGDHIHFQFSERPDEPMTFGLQSEYIVGPSGHGVFCNRFNYISGRWVTITGMKTLPPLDQIKGEQIRSDYERAADFECSSPLLNWVYGTTIWTFENLSLGGYVVDCPQRERRGYGGDAHSTTQTALDVFDMGAFYTKWAQDWRDVQSPDGDLPYTAPTYSGGGGVPWQGFCVHLPWKMFRQYGDTRILRDSFPTIRRWLTFMQTHVKDGILQRWGGQWDFLSDWVWPYDPRSDVPNGDLPETLFFNNCYYAYALETTAKIARILGDSHAAADYADQAFRLCQAIHHRFYRPATHDYANGHQNWLAVALLANVPPPAARPAVWKRLEEEIMVHRQGHIDAGITGGALLTRLLIEDNRPDLMYAMATKDDYPSWGYFKTLGLTTMPEIWNGDKSLLHSSYLFVGAAMATKDDYPSWGYFKTLGLTTMPEIWNGDKSLLHSSYLFVGAWFIEGLAGIRPGQEGGYQHFVLRPMIDAKPALTHVSAHYDSLYGRIAVSWTWKSSRLVLDVTVPPNTRGTLYLPATQAGEMHVHGGSGPRAPSGAASMRKEGNQYVLELTPGRYRLSD